MTLELWGIEDVAEALGIEVNTAYAWKHRGKLPAPEWVISNRPVWRATTVRKWIDRRELDAKIKAATKAAEKVHP